MSIIDTLITDRSASDVARWLAMKDKGLAGMSPQELAEWFGGMKGAYNAADLNRVGQAVAHVGWLLRSYGYAVTLTEKTDWAASGAYTAADLSAYLQDVETLRGILLVATELPPGMNGLTAAGANAIERVLVACDDALDRMAKSWLYAGEIYSGEV